MSVWEWLFQMWFISTANSWCPVPLSQAVTLTWRQMYHAVLPHFVFCFRLLTSQMSVQPERKVFTWFWGKVTPRTEISWISACFLEQAPWLHSASPSLWGCAVVQEWISFCPVVTGSYSTNVRHLRTEICLSNLPETFRLRVLLRFISGWERKPGYCLSWI